MTEKISIKNSSKNEMLLVRNDLKVFDSKINSRIIASENEVFLVWNDLKVFNCKIKNRIAISEKELSQILGQGYSESTLEKLRTDGTHFIEYIQIKERFRVLYPMINILEFLLNNKIENKTSWIKLQIKEMDFIDKKTQILNSNQLSKLLGVKASTISNYSKGDCFIKKTRKNYLINDISNWIVKSTIKCNTSEN